MKKKVKFAIIALMTSAIALLLLYSCSAMINGVWYTTEDIADYGEIKGNNSNDTVEAFLMSYFPQKLEPYFENIVYSYKANNECSYKTEMYLEFTISDPAQFQSYVTELTDGRMGQEYPYNVKYDDYIIHNHLYVEPVFDDETGEENHYYRFGARMGRILVCEEEQRVVFEGIIVYNCCGGYASEFAFYDRYGIDPQEYSDRFCDKNGMK